MARTTLTVQTRDHTKMNVTPGSATLTMTPGDPTNGNEFDVTGREIVIAQNTDSVARSIKLTAAEDFAGRSGDTGNYSIPAGGIAVFSVSPFAVWAQPGRVAFVDVDNAAVLLAVVRYP